jgi:5-formyltetrahydrofolate cyclo-ligase
MKQELRGKFKSIRESIGPHERKTKETLIAQNLKNHLKDIDFVSVGIYWPINSEVNCMDIFLQTTDHEVNGIELALPCIEGSKMLFREFKINHTLIKGPHGILQPKPSQKQIVPDLLIVPLIAFDRQCHRLGYGAGYYDLYLGQNPNIVTVGIAFAEQESTHIPVEAYDKRLSTIITDLEIIKQ